MSQENVESRGAFLDTWGRDSLRAFLDAVARGDADMSILDPDVTYEDMSLPDHAGETYRGHEGVIRATERWIDPYEGLTSRLEEIAGTDDRLVSIHRVRGSGRYTGIEFEGPVAYLWTFREGKVVHFKSFRDPEEALEAAGLSE